MNKISLRGFEIVPPQHVLGLVTIGEPQPPSKDPSWSSMTQTMTGSAGISEQSSSSVFLSRLQLSIELEQEDDGRWIAEIPDLPGVMVYGETKDIALTEVKTLGLRVLVERLEEGELPVYPDQIEFTVV